MGEAVHLWVGCRCGRTDPGWAASTPPASGRAPNCRTTSRGCNAVEGNTTFYAEPAPSTVARWAEQAPVDFRFALKVPRTVTHDRRLRDVTEPMRSFLRVVEPLDGRLGPFMVQLPGSFGPGDSMRWSRSCAGCRRTGGGCWNCATLRFSDGSATHATVDALCERHGIGRVLLDTRPLYAGESDSPAAAEEKRTSRACPCSSTPPAGAGWCA